jgi:hypothetical protein
LFDDSQRIHPNILIYHTNTSLYHLLNCISHFGQHVLEPFMTLNLNQPDLFRDRAFIDGQWVRAAEARTFPVFNPSTGSTLASVPDLGADETRAAIDAAEKALKPWQALTAKDRAALLRNWFNLILKNQDDLATIMTSEQGKPFAEAKGEVAYGASFVEWFAEEAKRIYGDVIPADWCGCGDHALELPDCHDHSESRSGAGGGLHGCDQTG